MKTSGYRVEFTLTSQFSHGYGCADDDSAPENWSRQSGCYCSTICTAAVAYCLTPKTQYATALSDVDAKGRFKSLQERKGLQNGDTRGKEVKRRFRSNTT